MPLLSEPVHLGQLTRTREEWYPMGRTPHNQQVFTSRCWDGSEDLQAKRVLPSMVGKDEDPVIEFQEPIPSSFLNPLPHPLDPRIEKTWIHVKISNKKLYRPTLLPNDYKKEKKKTPRITSLVTVCQNCNGLFWNKTSNIKKNNTSHVRIIKVRFRKNLETKGQTF